MSKKKLVPCNPTSPETVLKRENLCPFRAVKYVEHAPGAVGHPVGAADGKVVSPRAARGTRALMLDDQYLHVDWKNAVKDQCAGNKDCHDGGEGPCLFHFVLFVQQFVHCSLFNVIYTQQHFLLFVFFGQLETK